MEMGNLAGQLNKLQMTILESVLEQYILSSLPSQYGPCKIS